MEIDGKTVRRSAYKANGESPIHIAGAWATSNGVALGQVKTHDRSNETTTILELLKTLEIKGCIVTIDAMGCRKKRYSLNALIVYNSFNPTHKKGLKWRESAPADTT